MSSVFSLEFSKGKMQGTFPGSGEPGSDLAHSIVYESPRLTVATPFKDREKGSDRAICRTVNGVIQVRLLDTEVLRVNTTDSLLFAPIITAGLYGESSGVTGAIDIKQLYMSEFSFINSFNLYMYVMSGDIGFTAFSSYANLLPNIFMRVVMQVAPTRDGFYRPPIKINAVCSGVLMGADPR